MKNILVPFLFISTMISVLGQTQKTKCFALRIDNKKYLQDTSLLQPKLQLQGFYILQNGVYDFVVANKTYNYQRVFEISKDSIYVGYAFDTVPTLKFSIIDDFLIRLFTCYDGRCGFPNYITIKRNKYILEIIEPDNYCLLPAKKVCSSSYCKIEYPGYLYLIDHEELVVIYRKNDGDYALLGTQILKINKP